VARKVEWTLIALDDLGAAKAFIAKDSVQYADTFSSSILLSSRSLADLAERGRVVPEIRDERLRELILDSYRLIYKLDERVVTIVAFIHTARDLKRLWRARSKA
jgi:plasmid stabilization system protein ParE